MKLTRNIEASPSDRSTDIGFNWFLQTQSSSQSKADNIVRLKQEALKFAQPKIEDYKKAVQAEIKAKKALLKDYLKPNESAKEKLYEVIYSRASKTESEAYDKLWWDAYNKAEAIKETIVEAFKKADPAYKWRIPSATDVFVSMQRGNIVTKPEHDKNFREGNIVGKNLYYFIQRHGAELECLVRKDDPEYQGIACNR